MVLILMFNMCLGAKATESFLKVTLVSMVVLNADKFIAFVNNKFTFTPTDSLKDVKEDVKEDKEDGENE